MPARKPSSLHTRHATAAEKAERNRAESSMTPDRPLPKTPPARLKGHPAAAAAWRQLMRTYGELQAEIVTRLDLDLLVDYCLLMEQIAELDLMRRTTYQQWLELGKAHDQARTKSRKAAQLAKEQQRSAAQSGADLTGQIEQSLSEADEWGEKAVELAAKCLNAFDAVVKLDARADQKRKTLHQWRQSLYLTPRSRAGVAPPKKAEEQPLDPMDALLGEVIDFVNGQGNEE